MDVKVNVGGVDAVVSVSNADEAVALLASIARANIPSSSTNAPPDATSSGGHPQDDHSQDEAICEALRLIKGNPSAKLLLELSMSEQEWTADQVLKDNLGIPDDQNLGPALSHLSKCCKKAGVDKASIFGRKMRRGRKGKQFYWYSITPAAKRLVKTFEDFGKLDEDFVFGETPKVSISPAELSEVIRDV